MYERSLFFRCNIKKRKTFIIVNILASEFRTEMVLYSKFAYGSQFSGEKNDLKIGYLVAEILSKMHIGTLCMHFLTFGGAKMQQFSLTDDSFFKYHNFSILFSIFSTMENYQFLIRGSVLAVKTVTKLWSFWSNFGPLPAQMI